VQRESIEKRRIVCRFVPVHIREHDIGKLFDNAMHDSGLCFHEYPILSIQRSTNQQEEVSVDFLNSEMATRALNLNGIVCMSRTIWIGRPIQYSRSGADSSEARTWQEFNDNHDKKAALAEQAKQEKAAREYYVVNLPHDIDTKKFRNFLCFSMKRAGLVILPGGDPITTITIKEQVAYCIFRIPEEAQAALHLNDILYRGKKLRLKLSPSWFQSSYQYNAQKRFKIHSGSYDRQATRISTLSSNLATKKIATREGPLEKTTSSGNAVHHMIADRVGSSDVNAIDLQLKKESRPINFTNESPPVHFTKEDVHVAFQVAESLAIMRRQLQENEEERAKLEADLKRSKQEREAVETKLQEAHARGQ
jgi:hypothetical protein